MRFTFALVALTATTVTCQLSSIVAKIPTCALTCLATSAAAAGCGSTDWACQCGEKRASLTASATPCVLGGCTTEQAFGTLSVVNELCEAVAKTSPTVSTTPVTPGAATTTTATGTTTAGTKVATTSASGSSFASSITKPTAVVTPIQVPTGSASRMKVGAGVIGGAFLVAMAL